MKKILLIAVPLLFVLGCKDKEPVMCTAVVAELKVNMRYADGSPFSVDSVRVLRQPENTLFYRGGASEQQTQVSYTIADDSRKAEFNNQRFTVRFMAYRNGSVWATRDFVIGADQCHVRFFEGDNDIIVNHNTR